MQLSWFAGALPLITQLLPEYSCQLILAKHLLAVAVSSRAQHGAACAAKHNMQSKLPSEHNSSLIMRSP